MAKAQAAANTPPENTVSANMPPEDWDRAQTSFPPYWEPAEHTVDPKDKGAGWVHAKFLGVDDSDPNFTRNVFQAMGDVSCKQGSKKGKTATDVAVRAGELFTVSHYATFRVVRFVDVEVWFRCIGQKVANTASGFVWDFEVRVPPGKASILPGSPKSAELEG